MSSCCCCCRWQRYENGKERWEDVEGKSGRVNRGGKGGKWIIREGSREDKAGTVF